MSLKILSIMLCLIFSIPISGQQLNLSQNESINIVAVENDLPFSTTLADGSQVGFYIDFWHLVSKESKIPINIILTDFSHGLELVKANKAIHAGLFINDERSKWADFSIPINNISTRVLYNKNYKVINNLEELQGLQVGVISNTYQAKYLESNYPEIELVYFSELAKATEMLITKNISAVIDEGVRINSLINKLGLFDVLIQSKDVVFTNNLHITFVKGNEDLINIINRAIKNIPISEFIRIEKRWMPDKPSFYKDYSHISFLTVNEQDWLKENNVFTFASEKSWLPFEYVDDNNVFKGINADYISYLSSTLKISFNRDATLSWHEGYEALKRDELDIVSHIVTSSSRALEVSTTDSFFDIPGAIVVRRSNDLPTSLDELVGHKIGSISASYLSSIIHKDYQDMDVIEYESIQEALSSLNSGRIDAVIASLPVVNYEMLNSNLNNLIISGIVPQDFKLSIGVSSSNKPLIPIINKTMINMDNSIKQDIRNKWLSLNIFDGYSLTQILYWTIPTLILLCTIILFFVRMNLRLKREITTREASEKNQWLLQNQLFQLQKMEALGQLTGGIAHDFNNILGIILGYTALLKNKFKDHKELTPYINEIDFAGQRGKSLTSKILSFSRKKVLDKKPINIHKILINQYEMLQKTLTVRIQLIIDCDEDIWLVLANRNEFEDCILNLCINSMHALADNQVQPQITIRASNISRSLTELSSTHSSVREYVQISIIDNGCGIAQETIDKIFEPFFSTKQNKGTGLGLSQVYGFVNRFDGEIQVNSQVGEGTEVIIYLPRLSENIQVEDTTSPTSEDNYAGNESILIVDDEAALVNLAAITLSQEGYSVYKANDAIEALDIIKNNTIHVLLTDIIMPDIDGYQLAEKALEINPGIKIQFVSGYSDKREDELEAHLKQNKILHKPYTKIDLLKSIRYLLDL